MPKLTMPDGTELDGDQVEQQFAQAMAAPEPGEPQAPAPTPIDDPNVQVSGVPQPGEEDRKHSRARTRTAGASSASSGRGRRKTTGRASAKAAAPAPAEGAYVQPVAETLEALVLAAGILPFPESAFGVRVRLQGQLIQTHAGGLAVAIDSAARHNEVIRRGVEAVTMGAGGWVLPAVMMVAPFTMATAALWRGELTEEHVKEAAAFQADVQQQLMNKAAGNGEAGAAA